MKSRNLIIVILITVTVLISKSNAQEMGKWRNTKNFTVHEGVLHQPDAYTLHGIANFYAVKKFEDFGMKWWQADLTTFTLGVAWEVKDALIPLEKVAVFGGDGFSRSDIAVNAGVIIANRFLKLTLNSVLGFVSDKTSLNITAK